MHEYSGNESVRCIYSQCENEQQAGAAHKDSKRNEAGCAYMRRVFMRIQRHDSLRSEDSKMPLKWTAIARQMIVQTQTAAESPNPQYLPSLTTKDSAYRICKP